jgi:hypothetical protein
MPFSQVRLKYTPINTTGIQGAVGVMETVLIHINSLHSMLSTTSYVKEPKLIIKILVGVSTILKQVNNIVRGPQDDC